MATCLDGRSTRCRTRSTSRCSAQATSVIKASVLDGLEPGRPAPRAVLDNFGERGSSPLVGSRRPRSRRRDRGTLRDRADDRPPDGDLRVHDQGLRARDRRPAQEPHSALLDRRADRRSARRGLPPRERVGPSNRSREAEAWIGRPPRLDRQARPGLPARRGARRRSSRKIAPRHRRRPPSDGSCSICRASPAWPSASSRCRLTLRLDKPRRWINKAGYVGSSGSRSSTRWRTRRSSERLSPRGPPHRAGHRRDEPRAAARPARPQLGLPARALFPIGTLYDPFVMRALEGIVYPDLLRVHDSSSPARRPGSRCPAKAARTSRSAHPGSGSRPPG